MNHVGHPDQLYAPDDSLQELAFELGGNKWTSPKKAARMLRMPKTTQTQRRSNRFEAIDETGDNSFACVVHSPTQVEEPVTTF